MSRNSLYATIAVLVVLVLGIGIYVAWQESQKPRLEIQLNENGVSIDGNA